MMAALVSHYADDAVLEDPVETPPMMGKAATVAYLEGFLNWIKPQKGTKSSCAFCGYWNYR